MCPLWISVFVALLLLSFTITNSGLNLQEYEDIRMYSTYHFSFLPDCSCWLVFRKEHANPLATLKRFFLTSKVTPLHLCFLGDTSHINCVTMKYNLAELTLMGFMWVGCGTSLQAVICGSFLAMMQEEFISWIVPSLALLDEVPTWLPAVDGTASQHGQTFSLSSQWSDLAYSPRYYRLPGIKTQIINTWFESCEMMPCAVVFGAWDIGKRGANSVKKFHGNDREMGACRKSMGFASSCEPVADAMRGERVMEGERDGGSGSEMGGKSRERCGAAWEMGLRESQRRRDGERSGVDVMIRQWGKASCVAAGVNQAPCLLSLSLSLHLSPPFRSHGATSPHHHHQMPSSMQLAWALWCHLLYIQHTMSYTFLWGGGGGVSYWWWCWWW